jgi:hypothetical protein
MSMPVQLSELRKVDQQGRESWEMKCPTPAKTPLGTFLRTVENESIPRRSWDDL